MEFLILEGDNLSSLFPGAHLSIAGLHLEGKSMFSLLTAIFVLPTVWLRDLSYLAYVSGLAHFVCLEFVYTLIGTVQRILRSNFI